MHEISVMAGVVEAVLRGLEAHSYNRVISVTLHVGELTFLSPDSMRFAFEAMIGNTELKGAQLIIETVPATGVCRACGAETMVGPGEEPIHHYILPAFSCGECGGDLDIIRGRECTVGDVRVETD